MNVTVCGIILGPYRLHLHLALVSQYVKHSQNRYSYILCIYLYHADIDECTEVGGTVCDDITRATCSNTPGSYICLCNEGLYLSSDQTECIGNYY